MQEPVIKRLGIVYGDNKLIEKYERLYTIHYKKLYGDNCINQTNFKETKCKVGKLIKWNTK